jgi:hypothetical protein
MYTAVFYYIVRSNRIITDHGSHKVAANMSHQKKLVVAPRRLGILGFSKKKEIMKREWPWF